MIDRHIPSDPASRPFDFFNDWQDTCDWLRVMQKFPEHAANAEEALRILTERKAQHDDAERAERVKRVWDVPLHEQRPPRVIRAEARRKNFGS